jgi:hypothetical protein
MPIRVEQRKKYYSRNRQFVNDYLAAHPCLDCGETDIDVLEFDHRDPKLKRNNLAVMMSYGLKAITDEIAKCDVRCANCHHKKHKIRSRFTSKATAIALV